MRGGVGVAVPFVSVELCGGSVVLFLLCFLWSFSCTLSVFVVSMSVVRLSAL